MIEPNDLIEKSMDRRQAPDADATITLKRSTLNQISLRQKSFADALKAGEIGIVGHGDKRAELLGMVDNFAQMFDVVTPAGGDARR